MIVCVCVCLLLYTVCLAPLGVEAIAIGCWSQPYQYRTVNIIAIYSLALLHGTVPMYHTYL